MNDIKSMTNGYKPEWGERHDAVVERYEAKKRDGTARWLVISAKDNDSLPSKQ